MHTNDNTLIEFCVFFVFIVLSNIVGKIVIFLYFIKIKLQFQNQGVRKKILHDSL